MSMNKIASTWSCSGSPPLGGAAGKSSPSTSFMRNRPPSYGVPAASGMKR